jgi:hypothetical protein
MSFKAVDEERRSVQLIVALSDRAFHAESKREEFLDQITLWVNKFMNSKANHYDIPANVYSFVMLALSMGGNEIQKFKDNPPEAPQSYLVLRDIFKRYDEWKANIKKREDSRAGLFKYLSRNQFITGEYRLVVNANGSSYIHPLGKDGETYDFFVESDN